MMRPGREYAGSGIPAPLSGISKAEFGLSSVEGVTSTLSEAGPLKVAEDVPTWR